MGVFEQSIAIFLQPIKEALDDPSVSEVMINGPKDIWIERKGVIKRTDYEFEDETTLQAAIRNIAQSVGREINSTHPALDARLPDGSRIHAVIPPAARNGTTIAIRKFAKASDISIRKLIEIGAISADAAKFLAICVHMGKNLVISGGTGSGKTTILNILGSFIPRGQRVIIIEDSSELKIQAPHVVYFETKAPNKDGYGALTVRDLVKSSMRLRPDRIVVGEVRSGEALDLITAMNTGHDGTMGTVHANTARDALVRLETLSTMGDSTIPIEALRQQIASSIQLIVQVRRFSDGTRKIFTISEILGVSKDGVYNEKDIFRFVQKGKSKQGFVLGEMQPTGYIPTFMYEVKVNGYSFSEEKLRAPEKKEEAA